MVGPVEDVGACKPPRGGPVKGFQRRRWYQPGSHRDSRRRGSTEPVRLLCASWTVAGMVWPMARRTRLHVHLVTSRLR